MNKLDIPSQNVILVPEHASFPKPVAARRLIVLMPANVDCTAINHRIWELANESNSTVQILALYKDRDQEPSLRRELITMSALIQDANVPVEIKIEKGTNWLEAVKHNYHNGDMIVCPFEQPVGIQRRPLTQILESNLKVPIYILSGTQSARPQYKGLMQLTAWLGFAGIIVGFFVLQLKVIQLEIDPFQSILLILLLVPEFWLIQAWNSIFS
jgi:hypothetical protein